MQNDVYDLNALKIDVKTLLSTNINWPSVQVPIWKFFCRKCAPHVHPSSLCLHLSLSFYLCSILLFTSLSLSFYRCSLLLFTSLSLYLSISVRFSCLHLSLYLSISVRFSCLHISLPFYLCSILLFTSLSLSLSLSLSIFLSLFYSLVYIFVHLKHFFWLDVTIIYHKSNLLYHILLWLYGNFSVTSFPISASI